MSGFTAATLHRRRFFKRNSRRGTAKKDARLVAVDYIPRTAEKSTDRREISEKFRDCGITFSWGDSRNKWEGKNVDVIFDVISSTLQLRMCDSSRQIRHTG